MGGLLIDTRFERWYRLVGGWGGGFLGVDGPIFFFFAENFFSPVLLDRFEQGLCCLCALEILAPLADASGGLQP